MPKTKTDNTIRLDFSPSGNRGVGGVGVGVSVAAQTVSLPVVDFKR